MHCPAHSKNRLTFPTNLIFSRRTFNLLADRDNGLFDPTERRRVAAKDWGSVEEGGFPWKVALLVEKVCLQATTKEFVRFLAILLATPVGKNASAVSIESQNTLNTFCSSARKAAFSVKKSACALTEVEAKGLAILLVFS